MCSSKNPDGSYNTIHITGSFTGATPNRQYVLELDIENPRAGGQVTGTADANGNLTFDGDATKSVLNAFVTGTYELYVTDTVTGEDVVPADATATVSDGPACPSGQPPVAQLTVTPASGQAPLAVTADGSGSTDDNAVVSYNFAWGDGTSTGDQSGATASHTYSSAGSYTVILTVKDARGLSATASQSITVNQATQPPCSTPFMDVTTSNVFCPDIAWLAQQGITKGDGNGYFHPTAGVLRETEAAFIFRLENPGRPDPTCSAAPFKDVLASNLFCGDIAWLAQQGITKGDGNGYFHPTAGVLRETEAAFIYRLKNPGQPDPMCSAPPFKDVLTSNLFCGDIAWLAQQGITKGDENGNFEPTAGITRQAEAAFLHRTFG